MMQGEDNNNMTMDNHASTIPAAPATTATAPPSAADAASAAGAASKATASKKRRGGNGRKKIEIKKIENKNHLQVTFTKRRNGLFRKMSDLCTLCGVEGAVICFSPAGKPFAWGNPSVDAVMSRYLKDHAEQEGAIQQQLQQKPKENEEDKEGNDEEGFWWDTINIEDIQDPEELDAYLNALQGLRQNIVMRLEETAGTNTTRDFFGGC